MGVVCLAQDLRLDRRVAIKLLPPDQALQPAARERFLREVRTAAQLSHPHIVPVHSVGEIGDLVFFVMAYIEGQTLGQRVRAEGPLDARVAAAVLRDIASALAYAHARGIVHRDVKPDNILLEEGTGRALVTDFGIACGGTTAVTPGAATVSGTAEFMSPEQARGEPGDARSDLYSLGVTAYYVLSGRVPFEGVDGYAVIAQHLADPAPTLGSVAPTVPHMLAQYIDRCLEKEPARRPSGGVEFAAEVLRAVGEAPPAPLAVRAFLTESRQLSGPAYVYLLCTGLGVLPIAEQTLLFTAAPNLRLFAAVSALLILLVPFVQSVLRARRLLRAGHSRTDLTEALHGELIRRREELAFLFGAGPTRLERAFTALAYGGLVAAAGAIGVLVSGVPILTELQSLIVVAAGAGTALVAGVLARARTEHRTDPRWERRYRLWSGAFGRVIFRLAALGLGIAMDTTPTVVPSGRNVIVDPFVT